MELGFRWRNVLQIAGHGILDGGDRRVLGHVEHQFIGIRLVAAHPLEVLRGVAVDPEAVMLAGLDPAQNSEVPAVVAQVPYFPVARRAGIE